MSLLDLQRVNRGRRVPVVLIVNPDAAVRAYLERTVQRSRDVELRIAASGEEGLASLVDNCVQVVFVERDLPDVDGLEFLEALRTSPQFKRLQVVVTGESGGETAVRRALELGACYYLLKPYCQSLTGEVLDRAFQAFQRQGALA
jgi:two-component system chemotaxis response regulator CheY